MNVHAQRVGFPVPEPKRCRIGSRWFCAALLVLLMNSVPLFAADSTRGWPDITRTQKPWAYWWWMGNAVDRTNITRELIRYRDAGLGGVHIIPIYGARGWESSYIEYLSPEWVEMMRYTVREADRLGMGVDMTTGSGWCFGGPKVTDAEANAAVVQRQIEVPSQGRLTETFERDRIQALMAFGSNGEKVDLMPKLGADGSVNWQAPGGGWRVFVISQQPGAQKVKRASPGGEGWMLNLFHAQAMTNYLAWMDAGLGSRRGVKPRAQYHDSYEYKSDWAPDLFAQFERLRGYRLQDELPTLFSNADTDRVRRVKCDYRETLSELMSDVTLPLWVRWAHERGHLTRNEAHGSPGNLLDLYAVADVPETEMFNRDRNLLISKFASSAGHVMGRSLVASETGTWLKEHFTETLGDMKYLVDDLFLSGVNHVFYHGTCYSPDAAPWPGWVFYASYQMNPRNSVWDHVTTLNHYIARCQSVLQSGRPDNDVLLYWPIHDRWSDHRGLVQPFTVHARAWFEEQAIGRTADQLWRRGFQFDYVSDKQLALARVEDGAIEMPGGRYRVVVVPATQHMPEPTLRRLRTLVQNGATVIFHGQLPQDVPGLTQLTERRTRFREHIAYFHQLNSIPTGSGRVMVTSDLDKSLASAEVQRERMVDHSGLLCIRRTSSDGNYYFIANRGTNVVDGWLPIATPARTVMLMDPLTGRTGVAPSRQWSRNASEVKLSLASGESIILRLTSRRPLFARDWEYRPQGDTRIPLQGTWRVNFLKGGPELPNSFETRTLGSWTEQGGAQAQSFAGTARYTLEFDAPSDFKGGWLDFGDVRQSVRVRLNGRFVGTCITPPYRVWVDQLAPYNNVLEADVASVPANRIRDLDRRGVTWQYFRDINFVNIQYRPFNAANWPLADAGLLGPVTLIPLRSEP
jgi:hypothetical protein